MQAQKEAKKKGKKPQEDEEKSEEKNVEMEFLQLINDPLKMLYIKPIGQITETLEYSQDNITFKISKGKYYYMPQHQDTRLYRHDPIEKKDVTGDKSGFGDFQLQCCSYADIQMFIEQLKLVI